MEIIANPSNRLVELIAVVAVILILLAIVIPRVGKLCQQAQKAKARGNAWRLQDVSG
jgi:type II secretory pathway pseudopilin PulG